MIVDEIHVIGYTSRGPLLENIITRLQYQNYLNQHCLTTEKNTKLQIVGMSACISNLSDFANWFDAETYETNCLPVKLNQYFILNNTRYKVPHDFTWDKRSIAILPSEITSLDIQKNLLDPFCITGKDAAVVYYAIDAIARGFSALVFCSTQNDCEETAKAIAWQIGSIIAKKNLLSVRNNLVSKFIDCIEKGIHLEKLDKLKQTLEQESGSLSENLKTSLEFGIAFHHASLKNEERIIIEQALSQGTIKVLCSTSTLSMGKFVFFCYKSYF